MPLVSITQAAKMAKLSRPYFHEAYLKTGKITVDRSEPQKPKIDTSELLRIFGKIETIQDNSLPPYTITDTLHIAEEIELKIELERLRAENKGLVRLSEERLARLHEKDSLIAETKQEIIYYRERIQGFEARYDRLIEDKQYREQDAPISLWKRVKALFSP